MLKANNENIKVFLASSGRLNIFNDLIGVLHYANIEVSFVEDKLPLEALNVETIKKLSKTQCSIHIIADQYVEYPKHEYSISEFYYRQALKYSGQNPKFRLFVWLPGYYNDMPTDRYQMNFWHSILKNINENVIFTTHDSPIMFVEDIRSIMITNKSVVYDVKDADIYLIYNELDENSALIIKDLLSDIASVESTGISFSSGIDYNEYLVQQIDILFYQLYISKKPQSGPAIHHRIWEHTGGLSSGKMLFSLGRTIGRNQVYFDAQVTSIYLEELSLR